MTDKSPPTLLRPPLQVMNAGLDDDEEVEWVTEVRVLALMYGGSERGVEPTVAVMVSPSGGVIDLVQLPNIAERGRSEIAEARREADQVRSDSSLL